MSEWLPIETAPKDGRDFIGLGNNFGQPALGYHRVIVHWDAADEKFRDSGEIHGVMTYLTHWMPLPAPPSRALEGAGHHE